MLLFNFLSKIFPPASAQVEWGLNYATCYIGLGEPIKKETHFYEKVWIYVLILCLIPVGTVVFTFRQAKRLLNIKGFSVYKHAYLAEWRNIILAVLWTAIFYIGNTLSSFSIGLFERIEAWWLVWLIVLSGLNFLTALIYLFFGYKDIKFFYLALLFGLLLPVVLIFILVLPAMFFPSFKKYAPRDYQEQVRERLRQNLPPELRNK